MASVVQCSTLFVPRLMIRPIRRRQLLLDTAKRRKRSFGDTRRRCYHKTSFSCLQNSSRPVTLVKQSCLDTDECMDYARGWAWQQFLLNRRLVQRRLERQQEQPTTREEDDSDVVLFLEHKPVYTLGRGADENHLTFLQNDDQTETRERLSRRSRGRGSARLAVDRVFLDYLEERQSCEDEQPTTQQSTSNNTAAVDFLCETVGATPVMAPNGCPIYRVERGGEVTFHGPGQLVVYPVIDLQREPFQQDLHWFLNQIEEVIIRTLHHYDIVGTRDEINTGVWIGQDKVAAVGVTASRWITTHGFAINLFPDLSYFDTSVIMPCGIDGRGVTSIAEVLRERGDDYTVSLQELSEVVLRNMQKVFQIETERSESILK